MSVRLLTAAGLLALTAGTAALAPPPSQALSPSPPPSSTGDPAGPSPTAPPTAAPETSPAPSSAPTAPTTAAPTAPTTAAPATTVIALRGAVIDPKYPGRVRVTLAYTCAPAEGPRSLNTSAEQTDPTDPATVAFGATRTSPTQVVCDGTEQTQTVVVPSKTSNWLPGVDAVLITTLTDLGATPPAAADAREVLLDQAPAS
ncbi:hypothetical protein ACIQBJ_14965 [Kitasatospora sp. NPDC088391]|uniref:hypothetical protein n=1 Tax=Kitasatospora sp. NPDC088391 TaxID=3364074 RepID=UPI003829C276